MDINLKKFDEKFKLISLTKLDYKINSKNRQILAGNWCLGFAGNKKNKIILDYNLLNKKNYRYLESLLNFFSKICKDHLNNFHNVKYSQKSWDILLMPWLITYLPCQFTRWKIIKKAAKINKNISVINFKNLNKIHCKTTLDYLELIKKNDEFNYNIFIKILKFFSKKKLINLKEIDYKLKIKNKRIRKKKISIIKFYESLEKINFFFSKFNKLFLDPGMLKVKTYFRFSLALNQLPTFLFNKKIDDYLSQKYSYNYSLRTLINLHQNEKTYDNFKLFIFENIFQDMPSCFLEGFKIFNENIKKINFNPKVIFSGFSHFHNERFKFWLSNILNKKNKKLILYSHGGGYSLKFPSCFYFENKIASQKIVWTKPRKQNDVQMTPLKFINENKNQNCDKKYLLFLAEPSYDYPVRLAPGSQFNNFKNVSLLKKNIKKKIFNKFKYLPTTDINIYEKKGIIKLIGNKYHSKELIFHELKKFSKLTICTAPQTSFFESIINGPTILIYDFKKMPIISINNFDYSFLEKNLISFNNPEDAAKHINKIWDNIDEWWLQKSIKLTLDKLRDTYCLKEKHPYNTWLKYFSKKKNEIFKN